MSTMTESKINDHKMLHLIDNQGKSQSETAKLLGVSRQAISKRLKHLRSKATKAILRKPVNDAKLTIPQLPVNPLSKLSLLYPLKLIKRSKPVFSNALTP